MLSGKELKITVRVIVKAFPQPSAKYEETVCCAGIRQKTGKFVRLFPIRYRRLPKEKQFKVFDLVEMVVTKASDGRPESYRVNEDSIRIIEHATSSNLKPEQRIKLWAPYVYPDIESLEAAQKSDGVSLGIICPEEVRFTYQPFENADVDEQKELHNQQFLFEEPLKPMESPDYLFYYQFISGGKKCNRRIMDWEVQAAYYNFKRLYGSNALAMLEEQYAKRIPSQNLHFVMGTMASRRYLFILIGLLRSKLSPEDVARQGSLF